MKKKLLTIALAVLCLFLTANAQVLKVLQLGDKIPEDLWQAPLQIITPSGGKTTLTLNEYRGKLIILDFWATWCSGCIAAMPKLREIQQNFSENIKVLSVTEEGQGKVTAFISRNPQISSADIPAVVSDTILHKVFPHRFIPHYVWIGKDGTLMATTGTDGLTDPAVRDMLTGSPQKNAVKTKKDLDIQKPLFMSEAFSFGDSLLAYSIFLKGAYSGLPSGNHRISINGTVRGHASTNLPILDIYVSAVIPLFRQLGDKYSAKRNIIEVQNSADIQLKYVDSLSYSTDNLFNYELIVPRQKADSIPLLMLNELNRYSQYTGSIERRMTKCFALIKTGTSSEAYKTKSGPAKNTIGANTGPFVLSNMPVSSLVSRLNSDPSIPLPVVDRTGLTCNIDLTLSGNKSLRSLRAEFQRYGLDLIERQELLNMFVIKDKAPRSATTQIINK